MRGNANVSDFHGIQSIGHVPDAQDSSAEHRRAQVVGKLQYSQRPDHVQRRCCRFGVFALIDSGVSQNG